MTDKFVINEMPQLTDNDYMTTQKFMAAFTELIEMNDLTAIRMLRAVNKAMTAVNEKALKQREYRRAKKQGVDLEVPELDDTDLAFAEAERKVREAKEKKEKYDQYMKDCGAK